MYVADDDASILELLELLLQMDGFKVITSLNGLSLSKLEESPDMVFLDISMVGTNGADICRQYKLDPATAATPVVLVSADVDLETIAAECGADAILPKPFNVKDVVILARKHTQTGKS